MVLFTNTPETKAVALHPNEVVSLAEVLGAAVDVIWYVFELLPGLQKVMV
jgi:hypothetical protein